MNINLLAKLAGVSPSTVSKAFSYSKEVSDSTREAIFKIAKENGCFDRYNKNKYHKKVIGVICPEIYGDYYNATVTLLNKLIEEQGDIMTVSVSDFSQEKTAEIFNYFASYIKTDGIIVIGNVSKIQNPTFVPTVALDSNRSIEGISSIYVNHKNAVKQAVLHLLKQGYDTIGFAGEYLTKNKLTLIKRILREAGAPFYDKFAQIAPCRFEKAGVYAVEQWIKQGEMPKAIIAAYDFIAIGCIKALKENGYSVPDDVAVIGIDDVARAEYLETPLSSVHHSVNTACKTAIDILNQKMQNKYYMSGSVIQLEAGFIPRKSSQK